MKERLGELKTETNFMDEMPAERRNLYSTHNPNFLTLLEEELYSEKSNFKLVGFGRGRGADQLIWM